MKARAKVVPFRLALGREDGVLRAAEDDEQGADSIVTKAYEKQDERDQLNFRASGKSGHPS